MDGRPVRGLVLAVLLVASAVGTASAAAAGTCSPTEDPPGAHDRVIESTMTVALTPDEPGSIRVTVEYDLPFNVRRFEARVPDGATVVDTTGFSAADDDTYNWTGGDRSPTITFDYRANETSEGGRADAAHREGGQYDFVDVGPWALVRLPQMASRWSWAGEGTVSVRTRHRVAGEGVVGESMAYLGPGEVHRRTAAGQTFRLVVPAAADLRESPGDVLDSLAGAARSLRVGDRDPRVTFFTAPAGVGWAAGGLQYGDTDAWVLANASLDTPRNTWLHEYVHVRQEFALESETRWLYEATAEYYASLLTLRQDRIEYEAFRNHLAFGSNRVYDRTVLADQDTWPPGAAYFRGGLVVGGLDRRMRLATDDRATFADVFRELNRRTDRVSGPEYEGIVRTLAGDEVADAAVRWATTTTAPETWSRTEHRRAFGPAPPRFEVRLDAGEEPTFRVEGPYGGRTADAVPTVYPDEQLTVRFRVENAGEVAGDREVALVRNDTVVDRERVSLDPGQATTVALSTTFDRAGRYSLRAGTERVPVTVRRPANLSVERVSVEDTAVAPGEPVRVNLTVVGDPDRPAAGTVVVEADGAVVERKTFTLPAGGQSDVATTVTFTAPGEHTVAVCGRSTSVTVSAGNDGEGISTSTGLPGFGVVVALVAVTLAAAARVRLR